MPPIPAKTPEIETDQKRYNMRLKAATFINEIPPKRFPAGAVIAVDGDTAMRWMDHGVAEPAPANARSFRDQEQERKAEFLAHLEEIGAAEPVWNAAITRDSFQDEGRIGPKPLPKRRRGVQASAQPQRGRRGTAARTDLDGAAVVNAEEIIDEDDEE